MKFVCFNGLMLLAFYPIFFLYLWVNGKSLAATSSLAAALVIPLVAVILELYGVSENQSGRAIGAFGRSYKIMRK